MKTLRAAIYARKSNDDDHKCSDNKSITRQVENATNYANSKGWSVDKSNVYIDDGISGAEFVKRPGLIQLMKEKADFDVLVMSEISRLGRDAERTSLHLVELYDTGINVYYYLTDEQEKLDTATNRFMLRVKTYISEMEREKASERVSDTLFRKAKAGQVTGRPVYGYDHIPVNSTSASGEVTKSHSVYAINTIEAEVIISIFKMYRDGIGYKKIAKTLNGDTRQNHQKLLQKYFNGITPKRSNSKFPYWSQMQIKSMLNNERYSGIIPYGKRKNKYVGGSKSFEIRDKYIRVDRPDLRIVPIELCDNVQSRLKLMADKYADSRGGNVPFAGSVLEAGDSQYLLSGLCVCSECGSNFVSVGGTYGRGKNGKKKYKYGCSGNHNKGNQVCSNDHIVDLDELDEKIINAIKSKFLSASSVSYVVDKALEIIKKKKNKSPSIKIELIKEESKIELEIDKLIGLSDHIPNLDQLADKIKNKATRQSWLKDEISRLSEIELNENVDPSDLRNMLVGHITNFQNLVTSNVCDARKAIKHLLSEQIIISPAFKNGKKTIAYQGKTHAGRLMEPIEEDDYIGLVSP
jgi:site-specific DNA recombinase